MGAAHRFLWINRKNFQGHPSSPLFILFGIFVVIVAIILFVNEHVEQEIARTGRLSSPSPLPSSSPVIVKDARPAEDLETGYLKENVPVASSASPSQREDDRLREIIYELPLDSVELVY